MIIAKNRITASADAVPKLILVKASNIIRYASKVVALPGPPEVMQYTTSKLVIRHSVKKIESVNNVLAILCSVI